MYPATQSEIRSATARILETLAGGWLGGLGAGGWAFCPAGLKLSCGAGAEKVPVARLGSRVMSAPGGGGGLSSVYPKLGIGGAMSGAPGGGGAESKEGAGGTSWDVGVSAANGASESPRFLSFNFGGDGVVVSGTASSSASCLTNSLWLSNGSQTPEASFRNRIISSLLAAAIFHAICLALIGPSAMPLISRWYFIALDSMMFAISSLMGLQEGRI